MSHFAVYALTRNVGIDIVPPAPSVPGTAVPAFPARIFLSSPPAGRISDFAKFLQAGRVIAPPSYASRAGMPRARIFWQRYILCPAPGAAR